MFPSLSQDIIIQLMDNAETNDVLEQYHGTNGSKHKSLCLHHIVPTCCIRCIIFGIQDDERNPTERLSNTRLPCFMHKSICKHLECGILEQVSKSVIQVAISIGQILDADCVIGNSLLSLPMIAFLKLGLDKHDHQLAIETIVTQPSFLKTSFDFVSHMDNLPLAHPDSGPTFFMYRSLMPEMINKLNAVNKHVDLTGTAKLSKQCDGSNAGLGLIRQPTADTILDEQLSKFFALSCQKVIPRSNSTMESAKKTVMNLGAIPKV